MKDNIILAIVVFAITAFCLIALSVTLSAITRYKFEKIPQAQAIVYMKEE